MNIEKNGQVKGEEDVDYEDRIIKEKIQILVKFEEKKKEDKKEKVEEMELNKDMIKKVEEMEMQVSQEK